MSAAAERARREHYLEDVGPRDWSDAEVARWLVALSFKLHGVVNPVHLADALIAAPGVAPRTPRAVFKGLGVRVAEAIAMWEAHIGLDWAPARIASAFCADEETVHTTLGFMAAELRRGGELRSLDRLVKLHELIRERVEERASA